MVEKGESGQLSLFECGSVDLAKVRSMRQGLGSVSRAVSTIASYAYDWRQFGLWCAEVARSPMPVTADTLALYVTWLLVDQGKKVSTACRRVAAITYYNRQAGQPVPDCSEARAVICAVRRDRRERPHGKAALEHADMVRLCRLCDARTDAGARDRAIIVLGFATSLRRSDLAALKLTDVTFDRRGVAVFVRSSKTDQFAIGRVVPAWPGDRAITDPVRVLQRWIAVRGSWPGPLFCRVKDGVVLRAAITGEAVNAVVKRLVVGAGLDGARYGAHSLRAGSITASAELGSSDQELMRLSGHASATVMKMYVRSARAFSGRNPLAGLM